MSYQAIVTEIESIREHSNADRLKLADVMGYQVIVGLDAEVGDKVILFPDDGQLSHEYCKNNNLYQKAELNIDPDKSGYFDSKRRVRCQNLRGERSEAYVAGLNSLEFTGVDWQSIDVGTRFTEVNGVPICNKYITPATLKAANKQNKNKNKTEKGFNRDEVKSVFKKHFDTEQLRQVKDRDLTGLITLTWKLHGTSGRSCNLKVPVYKPQNWLQRLLKKKNEPVYEFKSLYGTRNVIKGEVKPEHDCYRTNAHRMLEPHIKKGETWYYEIVGYEQGMGENCKSIMPAVCTKKFPKEMRKQFGESIVYKYGCLPNTFDVYVYRITVQNDDNDVYELPWYEVQDRCRKAGVNPVPEAEQLLIHTEEGAKILREIIEKYVDHDYVDPIDPSHLKEGICVRVDNMRGTRTFKSKNFWFKVGEGIIKDADIVDTEEMEANAE